MFPIILDISNLRVMLIGNGAATARRLELLRYSSEAKITLFADAPSEELKIAAQNNFINHLPSPDEFEGFSCVMIADFDEKKSAELAGVARQKKILVNVEDKVKYCDFHVPAIVRRGDLLLTVSTNNSSPRVARRVRMLLEKMFTSNWDNWLKTMKSKRSEWKKSGIGIAEIATKTDEIINSQGWLKEVCECKVTQ